MRRAPHTLRARIAVFAAAAAAFAVLVLVAGFNLMLRAALDADVANRLRATAAAATTTTSIGDDGRVTVRESPDDQEIDQQVWIYDGLHAVVRPPAGARLQRAADALAGEARTFDQVGDHLARLYAAPLTEDGRQVGTVVVAEPLEAWDRTTDLALAGSAGLGLVLLLGIVALTWAATGRALSPVRDMTRSAAAWNATDLDRRFGDQARPDELGELARTFDAMLDRVAASLRHEQRLSAELSHELRTPLARIIAEVELLRRRERSPAERDMALAQIERTADEMSAILETLMAAARADAGTRRGQSSLEDALARAELSWHAAPVELRIEPGTDELTVGADAEVVDRILAPLLENAGRHARTHVRVGARQGPGYGLVWVEDDGKGIPRALRERVFDPGVTGDDHAGAGLGLSLARRLARAAGGDVTAVDATLDGGARFEVRLPL